VNRTAWMTGIATLTWSALASVQIGAPTAAHGAPSPPADASGIVQAPPGPPPPGGPPPAEIMPSSNEPASEETAFAVSPELNRLDALFVDGATVRRLTQVRVDTLAMRAPPRRR
jgi:hypothetical protein